MCITLPNFTKLGQTVTEVSHLTVFKMAATCSVGFLKNSIFEHPLWSGIMDFSRGNIKFVRDQTVLSDLT